MSEPEIVYSYWRHAWRGTCHVAVEGKDWGRFTTMFEPITEDEYLDWVWGRQRMWLWDETTAREELGLELL